MILPVQFVPEDLIIILLLAYVIDLAFNEPPFAVHPVVWMGNLISGLKKIAPSNYRRVYGIFLALVTITFAASIAYAVLLVFSIEAIPRIIRLVIAAYFLKATFSIRCLFEAAREIKSKLEADKLDEARQGLSMYVSRNTSKLDESHVSSAIIETVSENYVDGILTPLLFYACFGPLGLIAAYIFKATSTLDSMVGYKDERHLQIGWFSARLDDVLNWIPARLSVIYIFLASVVVSASLKTYKKISPAGAVQLALRDGMKTPSPNSGFPMSSVAGALMIRLEKPGTYVLGEEYVYPVREDVRLTAWIVMVASFIAIITSVLIIYGIGLLTLG
ncbi:cobalamin biosynthesis protein [Methanolobus halotolerans]|uniref:Probable cobalamin biosynthesis protein CobD n=1 Tax=Methanolobus halotolerans TaxID=2052935 RepID=A0A4E0PZ52_9EURY|nr:cobalamin biosynthesis protein [Methanolobus halotolerans]TGC09130.1 cobalamin biosynthesis protein [Methanolobus halotolerans]